MGVAFDDVAFESRLAWIFGSPRTGSTWLLRMLVHPWRLKRNEIGVDGPAGGREAPDGPKVVPVNEPHVPIHLTPLVLPHDCAIEHARPEELLKNNERAQDAGYFFNDVMRTYGARRSGA